MSTPKTRALLVDVARELFAKNGIEATTMNDIALASGKGRRTLYTYFRSKEDVYYAVIEHELKLMSEKMDEVAAMLVDPLEKVFQLVYTHLHMIRETVSRNGSLRAEFFRNIWKVEGVRKTFDAEEIRLLNQVLTEGVEKGALKIDHISLMAEIIHYTIKGLEVPYIFNRLGGGLTEEETYPIVKDIVRRMLGAV